MALQTGDRLPEASFKTLTSDGMQDISTKELCDGKTVVLFAVPGAFTPTCSDVHLPGFIDRHQEMLERGADTVACLAVNDAFVMSAWKKSRGIPQPILMLSDGNGDFADATGLSMDVSAFGMGHRSKRYAMIVRDGVVSYLGVEPGREVGVSSADAVLENL
ncbi:MAG: peroxiredoxin [Acidobacteria bacterium]|mgnify:CR=1 FL=1|nr:MAG: peroxiredoxin [Acidobacteriota bacterium]REK11257.1 MAG: peroxiredoxin [Acidobacteriota bacterium]